MIETLSISEITNYIKVLLEDDQVLQSVWLKGEISNYTFHSSGHQYFSLKDEGATIRCVKFKNFGYSPVQQSFKTGDKVMVHGSIDLYPPQGSYQLRVTQIHLQGKGDLQQQFEALKNKLALEGLFDASRKIPIPVFPTTIGVISSATGAVIQDILNTAQRRFPAVKIILAPALMQGENAAKSVITALDKLEKIEDLNTIIIARGGGSMEDLWAFNDEELIRRIAGARKPIISAIGHETDFTLCDFAADLRAPTPTAAAELALPDKEELLLRINSLKKNAIRSTNNLLAYHMQHIDGLKEALSDGLQYCFENKKHQLEKIALRLENANPLMPMQKGFTLTLKNGERVKSSKELNTGDKLETMFNDGTINSIVS